MIQKVGVVGAGLMGSEIALVFALAGFLLAVGLWAVFGLRSGGAVDLEPVAVGAAVEDDGPDIPVADLWPAPSDRFEGRTMRFLRPDPRVKVMPGSTVNVADGS